MYLIRSGFTIVELLISIAVLSLIVGFTYANYAKTTQKQSLISAGQTMKNILRDVATRSLVGEVDCSVCGCTAGSSKNFSGWVVDFTQMQFYGQCESDSFSPQSFSLPEKVTFTQDLSTENTVLFRHFPPGTETPGTICIHHTDLPSTYYRLVVSASGDISDSGGLISSCP